jgi:hypothetical protein
LGRRAILLAGFRFSMRRPAYNKPEDSAIL